MIQIVRSARLHHSCRQPNPMARDRISVLFVCLGNICRSPMASATFAHIVDSQGVQDHFGRIESAGTADYHIGELPDERTIYTCRKHGIPIDSVAQSVQPRHFDEFDFILAMDAQNLANLKHMQPNDSSKAVVQLFGEYGDGLPIADPYYGGKDGFELCYTQIVAYSDGFLSAMGLTNNERRSLRARA